MGKMKTLKPSTRLLLKIGRSRKRNIKKLVKRFGAGPRLGVPASEKKARLGSAQTLRRLRKEKGRKGAVRQLFEARK